MKPILKILSFVFPTFCIINILHTATFAASLGGTCNGWITITMAENAEKMCQKFVSEGYKRFPSKTDCIICDPDDWTSNVVTKTPAIQWSSKGSLPPAQKINGKEVAWPRKCSDGTIQWIRAVNSPKGTYAYKDRRTGKLVYGSFYPDMRANACNK